MAQIPRSFIDQLLAKVDIVDIIRSRLELKKAGRNHQACCPFHQEKTPSFTVSEEKQFYHCFGCGAHGTAIGFLMQYDNLNFVDAVESLAERAGLTVPKEPTYGGNFTHKNKRQIKNGEAEYNINEEHNLYEVMQLTNDFFCKQLESSTEAKNYLKRRGLNQQIVQEFNIGYAPFGWHNLVNYMEKKSIKKETLKSLDLISVNEQGKLYDRFRHRLIFPIIDRRGRTVAFGGRVIKEEDQPKYLNSSETEIFQKRKELFGLYQCLQKNRNPNFLLVTEGYMDVVALFQSGFYQAVASMGTALTIEQITLLFRQCKKIVFCFDGDHAGQQAAQRALKTILPYIKEEWSINFLLMPKGEDPDSFIKNNSLNIFLQQIDNSLSLPDFIQHTLSLIGTPKKAEEKPLLIKTGKEWLALCADNGWRISLQESLSNYLKIDKVHLESRKKSNEQEDYLNSLSPIIQRKRVAALSVEEKIIAFILQFPSLLFQLEEQEIQTITSHTSLLVNQIVQIVLSSQEKLNAAVLMEKWSDNAEIYEMIKRCSIYDNPLNEQATLNELKQISRQLSDKQLKQEIRQIQEKINNFGVDTLTEQEKENYLKLLKQSKAR